MKNYSCGFRAALILLSFALAAGCENADPNGPKSSNADSYAGETNRSGFGGLPQKTKNLTLEADLRPKWMKQIYGISDESIAAAEQYLVTLGVDRKYNITGSFVGGIDKLDLELLPNASENKSLSIQFHFHSGEKILGGPEKVLKWLELDNRLLETEKTNGAHAE